MLLRWPCLGSLGIGLIDGTNVQLSCLRRNEKTLRSAEYNCGRHRRKILVHSFVSNSGHNTNAQIQTELLLIRFPFIEFDAIIWT